MAITPFQEKICFGTGDFNRPMTNLARPSRCQILATGLQNILQRMILPQFVEFDILVETFQGGVAGGLFEAGDVDALGDPARDRTAPQAVPGEGGAVEPGKPGPFLTTSAIESVSIGSVPIR
jgi:hypothetical protein